ncbi:MAG: glycosyltransferase, partial [Candidatus Latescibacteria bacterium]|nr:glycosyltransferase [bacterium]MBD3423103.1 glycosyltransferase [Candidatus Latescibacterota bacterium]
MRVMVALSFSPWPVRRGTDRLVINLLRGLSRYHRVKLLTMVLDPEGIGKLDELENDRISVEAIVAPHRRSFLSRVYYKIRNMVLSVLMRIPVQSLYAAPPAYLKLVAEEAVRWDADLTLVNYWHLEKLSRMINRGEKILLTHDLDFMNCRGRIDSAGGFFGRLISKAGCSIRTRLELKAYGSFDRIMTVTEKEADDLKNFLKEPEKKIVPLPMAMDLEEFRADPRKWVRNSILLLGVFYSDFNRDSLIYFMEEILSRVISRKPDARVDIVGPGIPDWVGKSLGRRGKVWGKVDDIKIHLEKSTVMALPLRFAAGVRIRMLEAAAAGLPVVSTPAGVRG